MAETQTHTHTRTVERDPQFPLHMLLVHKASIQSEGEPVLFFPLRVVIIMDRDGTRINYDGRIVDGLGQATPQTATFAEQELAEVPPEIIQRVQAACSRAPGSGLLVPNRGGRIAH